MNYKYFKYLWLLIALFFSSVSKGQDSAGAWIRVNQLGYLPSGIKVAVWAGKTVKTITSFDVVDAASGKVVFTGNASKAFGSYGPFAQCFRLPFTNLKIPGNYYLKVGETTSPGFRIDNDIYSGTADFALRYMRQQRSGFNPFLKDSCHTKDGYTVYGPMPDNTHIDVAGGWHDATDYLQYVTTSANATYHLLAAFRDFPKVFGDAHLSNGLDGKNGTADVMDEAKWGLDWLVKMNPRNDWMFNQLADDRDHAGLRLPSKDSVDYGNGKGNGRTVYFATGKPQGLNRHLNRSTGVASTAGKFTSAFALASMVYSQTNSTLSAMFKAKSLAAYKLALAMPGVCQTAPNREPYFYEEDNWVDDMELASASLYQLTGDVNYLKQSLGYSMAEKVTPWIGADTAKHYQWYPFHNFAHYELAKKNNSKELIGYYKEGIDRVWNKAVKNAFYKGIPFIWCSNNLTVSFAIQCSLYRKLSGDQQYAELEQACIDWLFGCNPWGKCMVYGLPGNGDTPLHPHSSLSYLYQYPLDGGLVDGPLFGSIYKRMVGLRLYNPDKYAPFQSDLVVYHDDAGDYSTNEPTMDGTASLVYLLAGKEQEALQKKKVTESFGGITRGDTTKKNIALVFTGDEFADGGDFIFRTLKKENIKASFFLTGNFYRDPKNRQLVEKLNNTGNYLGSHSDKHLLYNDWIRRDSMLITKESFDKDLKDSFKELSKFKIKQSEAKYFLPPYEWYNDSIAQWTSELGLQLVNFSTGTRSTADYSYPEMDAKYVDSKTIKESILSYEGHSATGLNGFILLFHIGTDPRRKDKFYFQLPELLLDLKNKGYGFLPINELLNN